MIKEDLLSPWDWAKWEDAVIAEIPNFMVVLYISSGENRWMSFDNLAQAITSPKVFENMGKPEWRSHFQTALDRVVVAGSIEQDAASGLYRLNKEKK